MDSIFINIILSLLILIIICFLISLLSIFFSEKNPDKEKTCTYECGFNPKFYPGTPFSIKFFIVAIIFLIFDLEMIILYPGIVTFKKIFLNGQIIVMIFIFLIILGLFYEGIKGALDGE